MQLSFLSEKSLNFIHKQFSKKSRAKRIHTRLCARSFKSVQIDLSFGTFILLRLLNTYLLKNLILIVFEIAVHAAPFFHKTKKPLYYS